MARGRCASTRDAILRARNAWRIKRIAMEPIISVSRLSKTYASGLCALRHIDLDIRRGEIFALLGPNGAGKTTLISIICGIVTLTEGMVLVAGYDIGRDYRVT